MQNCTTKKNFFPFFIIGLLLSGLLLVNLANLFGFVNWENLSFFTLEIQILFLLGLLFISYHELNKPIRREAIFTYKSLPILGLCVALTFAYMSKASEITAAVFITLSLFYLIKDRKFYALNKIYWYLFLFAFLRVVGTIGTPQGFHFPDKILLFFLLPLAFSCFRLKKITLMRILKFSFRVNLLYLTCSFIFWGYSALLFDLPLINWVINKFQGSNIITPIYQWTSAWSLYEHPSFNSLLIVFNLISGFYLLYKNDERAKIGRFELLTALVLSVIIITLIQSRVGFIMLIAVLVATALSFAKLETKRFKQTLAATIVLIGIFALCFNTLILKFVKDEPRTENYILAIDYIKDHPLWGCGYYQQSVVLEAQYEKMLDQLPQIGFKSNKDYVHNQFIGDTLQFGFLGLFVLLLLIYQLFKYAFAVRSYPLQMLMTAVVLFMSIEEPFYMQPGITRITLFLCLFVALAESEKTKKSYELKRNTKRDE